MASSAPHTSGTPATGAVVALKPAATAKSRLTEISIPLRRRLAQAMALDTLTALAAAPVTVVVVSDDPALPRILSAAGITADLVPEPSPPGMNAALAAGAEQLRAAGHDPVLACVGDLPALRPESVRAVLAASGPGQRAFVADASGVGTSMLIASGLPLNPRFQGGSAAAHRDSGARQIDDRDLVRAVPDARTDVDDLASLADAIALGVGPHTARLVDTDAGSVAEYQPVTVAAGGDEQHYPVITDAGVRLRLPVGQVDAQVRLLRPGQRLHSVRVRDHLLSAWI